MYTEEKTPLNDIYRHIYNVMLRLHDVSQLNAFINTVFSARVHVFEMKLAYMCIEGFKFMRIKEK